MSLLSDYHGPATRSRAMGLHQSSVYAGTILGGVVAGYCGDYYGWRTGFYLFGGLGAALAVVLVFTLREPARGAADAPAPTVADALRGVAEVLSSRLAWLLIAVFIGANFVAVIFLTGWTRDATVLAVALAGFGFFKGVYDSNIWASLYDGVRPARRATAQGLMNALGWLGAGAAPVAIAVASGRFGMGPCLSATALIYVLFGSLMLAGSLTLAPRIAAAPAKETAP